jgi:hypothetical protein
MLRHSRFLHAHKLAHSRDFFVEWLGPDIITRLLNNCGIASADFQLTVLRFSNILSALDFQLAWPVGMGSRIAGLPPQSNCGSQFVHLCAVGFNDPLL